MTQPDLNIFTCCDGVFKDFIPLFALSHLYFNKNSVVEVGVDSPINDKDGRAISAVQEIFPDRLLVRTVPFIPEIPASIRFITNPELISKYVYITDVDILCLRPDILETHLDIMNTNNMGYSNVVRPGTERLTGLHFTPYKNYYPMEKVKNGLLELSNEKLLYQLVKNKQPLNIKLPFNEDTRPIFGIHASLRRNTWNIDHWEDRWCSFIKTHEYRTVFPLFPSSMKIAVLMRITNIMRNLFK